MGCDLSGILRRRASVAFQSTHPSGVRQYGHDDSLKKLEISIHAPQWGATPKKRYFYYMTEFQSTHPSGVRLFRLAGVRLGLVHFNPRTPVGCDQHGRCSALHSRKFQSTHPSGVRRSYEKQDGATQGISIHAPQWGATDAFWAWWAYVQISIHAPQWGATGGPRDVSRGRCISIHAPQWGATPVILPHRSDTQLFQSTHPSGVRRI